MKSNDLNLMDRIRLRRTAVGRTSLIIALALGTFAAAEPIYTPPELRLGQANKLLQGAFHTIPADMAPDSSLFGGAAISQESWIAGKLNNAQGKTYFLILSHKRDNTAAFTMVSWLPTDAGGRPQPEERMPKLPVSAMGPGVPGRRSVKLTYEPDTGLRFIETGDAAASIDITVTDKDLTWKQAGVIDLKGKIATPGILQYIPWRNERMTGIHAWTIQEFLASGTLFGEPVTGFLHMDRSYDRIPYHEAPMWTKMEAGGWAQHWVNEYDDNTAEMGVFMCGGAGSPELYGNIGRGAVAANNQGKEIFNTNKFTVKPKYDEKGKLVRVDYNVDGEQWELIPAPNSQGWGEVKGMARIIDGRTVRKGEKRKLLRSWTVAGGLIDPAACATLP